MNSPIQGKNVSLRASNGSDYIDWVCLTGITIQKNTEVIAATTVGNGVSRTYRPRFTDATITCTGISTTNDSNDAWTVFHSLSDSTRNDGLDLEIEFEDNEGELKNVRCFAYIVSTTINNNVEDFSDFEIQFQVSGPLTLDSFATPITSDVESYPLTFNDETTNFLDAALVGKTILEFSRDGVAKEVITSGTPTEKQIKYTSSTGAFHTNDTIPFMPGEFVLVLYK